MTLAQTVIMIGIGSLLIQPLAGENIWSTLYVGALLVLTLIIVEYSQLKFNFLEELVTGNSKVLVENGHLNIKNLRSVRLTVDQLETQLRLNSISKISDVKWATIEPNGQVAFVLKDDNQPATKKDLATINQELNQIKGLISSNKPQWSHTKTEQTQVMIENLNNQITQLKNQLKTYTNNEDQDIFKEIENESHQTPPPKHLQ
ncbi:DUF421 domain-containing protein [Bacillus tamaricis]|uniref:DUF421 domain-containing protein n=2 Tax=Evansella tamaricis TaxID=2069301 RepID=A0ABS6JAB6_9BACI|nr:DUF421 domain-containing protein [Evansella tamaricis]